MGKFEIEVTVKLEESLKSLINTLFGKVQVNAEEQKTETTKKATKTKKDVKTEEVQANNEVELTTNDVKSYTELREQLKKLAMEKRGEGHNIVQILKNLGAKSFKDLPNEKLEMFKNELEKL